MNMRSDQALFHNVTTDHNVRDERKGGDDPGLKNPHREESSEVENAIIPEPASVVYSKTTDSSVELNHKEMVEPSSKKSSAEERTEAENAIIPEPASTVYSKTNDSSVELDHEEMIEPSSKKEECIEVENIIPEPVSAVSGFEQHWPKSGKERSSRLSLKSQRDKSRYFSQDATIKPYLSQQNKTTAVQIKDKAMARQSLKEVKNKVHIELSSDDEEFVFKPKRNV